MDVSIIIINYKTKDLVLDAIQSIKEKTKDILYEIIVVDNASNDGSIPAIESLNPEVITIASQENLGFGKANNLGAKSASGKYLFLLNSDTLLVNNAIKILFDFLEENQSNKVGIAGANLYTAELKPNFSYSNHLPTLWSHFLYRFYILALLGAETFNHTGKNKKVGQIIGADLMISKSLYDKIGGFDPYYFMYVEDTDLQKSVTLLGYHIYSVPAAKIIHLQGASSLSYQKLTWEIDGYKYYFRKFYNEKVKNRYLKIEKISMRIRKLRYQWSGNREYVKVINQILDDLK